MVIRHDENGLPLEIRCDICTVVYDDPNELEEFMQFDFVMGPVSQYPDAIVKFDCCQDCFSDAFPTVFAAIEAEEQVEEVAEVDEWGTQEGGR
jgi:hypothetical protein